MDDIWKRAWQWVRGAGDNTGYPYYAMIKEAAIAAIGSTKYYRISFEELKKEHREAIEAELIKRRLKNGS